MQSFTTQSHQRNYQGSVVVTNPNTALTLLRQKNRRHRVVSGIALATMALAVTVTGSLWGATALHNQQLKHELHTLQTQTTPVVAEIESSPADFPMTLEAIYDEQSLTAPTAPQPPDDTNAPTPPPHEHRHQPRNRSQNRTWQRPPVSEQQHAVQPLPTVDHA